MKLFIKTVLLFSLLLVVIAEAESTSNSKFETDDKENVAVANSMGPVDILNLSGTYEGEDVECFKIISLPDPSAGVLYLDDGETEVEEGQVLSVDEANCLKFEPNSNSVGDASFQYASVNNDGEVDPNPATFCIPIYEEECSDSEEASTSEEECDCKNYSSSIPSLSLWGVLMMLMLTLIITREELNREF